MAFEIYFSVSKTAVELIALGLIAGCAVYVIKDLIDEDNPEATFEG